MPARYFKWSYDMKKIILMLCLLAVSVTMYGCTSKEIHKDSGLMKITDDNGRQVAFSKKPERIVVLSPSFLELLEVLDGNVVGRAESTIVRTPDFAKNAAVVGFIFNINTEKVVELKPDLIVAYKGMHEKYIQLFEANGIPVVVLNLKTYEDVKHSIKILGELTGQKEKGIKIASELDKKVQNTVKQLPKNTKLLQLHNIVQDIQSVTAPTGEQMSDKAPYNLEFLIEKDPEIIFITSMGDKNDIEVRLQNDVMSSPAWESITAVKNNAVYYLPDELFLLNPGLRYSQAVEYMASKLQE